MAVFLKVAQKTGFRLPKILILSKLEKLTLEDLLWFHFLCWPYHSQKRHSSFQNLNEAAPRRDQPSVSRVSGLRFHVTLRRMMWSVSALSMAKELASSTCSCYWNSRNLACVRAIIFCYRALSACCHCCYWPLFHRVDVVEFPHYRQSVLALRNSLKPRHPLYTEVLLIDSKLVRKISHCWKT